MKVQQSGQSWNTVFNFKSAQTSQCSLAKFVPKL